MFKRLSLAILSLSFVFVSQASAGLIGSWEVDQGPNWESSPTAYSGQQAAALLFGGSPSDYSISTNSTTVTHTAWYSIIYVGTGEFADNFEQNTGGLYQTPGDVSAYVADNASGPDFTNYAFSATVSTPEPGTIGLTFSAGMLLLAGARRRLRKPRA